MNKEERRRNKISKLMLDLFLIYLEDRKPIVLDYSMLDMHYKLTFDAKNLNKTKDDLKNIAIWCKTKNQAQKCCDLADRLGWKNIRGGSFKDDYFYLYEDSTAYDFFKGTQDFEHHYWRDGYKMRTAKWFLDNFTPKE